MENEQFDKIEAYLNQEMSPEEKKAFETEVDTNPELQVELRRHKILNKVIEINGQYKVRAMVEEVRQKIGPLPEPKLTLFDHIRFFFYSKINRAIGIGVLSVVVLFGGWLVVESFFCPLAKISSVYFIEVKNKETAGVGEFDASILPRSRAFYFNNQTDSLFSTIQFTNAPCVPTYFLAHWYLKNQDFQLAEETFTNLLSDNECLQPYSELRDVGLIKFHLLLSKLGNYKNWDIALAELNTLQSDPDFIGTIVRDRAVQLKKDLENPYLRLLCFK